MYACVPPRIDKAFTLYTRSYTHLVKFFPSFQKHTVQVSFVFAVNFDFYFFFVFFFLRCFWLLWFCESAKTQLSTIWQRPPIFNLPITTYRTALYVCVCVDIFRNIKIISERTVLYVQYPLQYIFIRNLLYRVRISSLPFPALFIHRLYIRYRPTTTDKMNVHLLPERNLY